MAVHPVRQPNGEREGGREGGVREGRVKEGGRGGVYPHARLSYRLLITMYMYMYFLPPLSSH